MTGIHPFLPPKQPTRSAVVIALETLFGILKLPFFLVISFWLLLFTTIASLIPVAVLRRPFARYIHFLGCRSVDGCRAFESLKNKQSAAIFARILQYSAEACVYTVDCESLVWCFRIDREWRRHCVQPRVDSRHSLLCISIRCLLCISCSSMASNCERTRRR
jgi:hypothetical protein